MSKGIINIILEENTRLKELFKGIDIVQRERYIQGYEDAMIYMDKLEQYRRKQTKTFWDGVNGKKG